MRTYLEDLLTTLAFDKDDAAYLCDAYDVLGAVPCFGEAIALYEERRGDHEAVLRLADEAAAVTGVAEYTAELVVCLCMAKTLQERYRARGIPYEIFVNSMRDLCYKTAECKAVKGIVGSFVAGWFAGFFDMTRFALGRLQFELIPFGAHYEKDGKRLTPDSRVINVHIPRTGTPLAADDCEKAYAQAKAFFAPQLEDATAFVCHSWLLYPENETILSERGNIVRFMKRYEVIEWGVDKNKADLWRLFDTDEQHPDRLPTDTSARRAYVQHLKAGGKLGWGYGVFFA